MKSQLYSCAKIHKDAHFYKTREVRSKVFFCQPPGRSAQFQKCEISPSHLSIDPVEREAQKSDKNNDLCPWANWFATTFLNWKFPPECRSPQKDQTSSIVPVTWWRHDEKELKLSHCILHDHESEKTLFIREGAAMGWESPRELRQWKLLTQKWGQEYIRIPHWLSRIPKFCL